MLDDPSSFEHVSTSETTNENVVPVLKQTSTIITATAVLEWRIENFSQLWQFAEKGHKIESKSFVYPCCQGLSWKLEVYPNGYDEDEDHVYFGLTKNSGFLRKISDALFAKTQKTNDDLQKTNYQIYISNGKEKLLNVTHFATREEVVTAIDSDKCLSVICEVESLVPEKTVHNETETKSFKRLFSKI